MNGSTPKVDILLGTYVSEDKDEVIGYLRQQLDSLVVQDYTNYRVLIRDDGSTHPDVFKVLEEYKEAYPELINIIKDDDGNLSYGGNFERLMEHSDAPYVMFCDQDDVWHPNKLSRSVAQLQAQEAKHGKDTPILVHHNARVVGPNGEVYHKTMEDNWGEDFNESSTMRAIGGNPVLGCTMVLNRALVDKSLPFSEGARGKPGKTFGHDGHVYSVAQLLGKVFHDDQPLMDYRIHATNTSTPTLNDPNAQKKDNRIPWWNIKGKFNAYANFYYVHRLRVKRAKEFLTQYGDDPSFKPEDKKVLEAFASLKGFDYLKRWRALQQYGFYKNNGIAANFIATFMP